MPKERTGSVYRRGVDGRWAVQITIATGRRRVFYGRTEEEARRKAAEADLAVVQPRRAPAWHRTPAQRLAVATSVLARARRLAWDDAMTARVLAASFSNNRVARGVVGPCVYCGTEFADTVDHSTPFAKGGKDVAGNVVSSCATCNAGKAKMGAEFGKLRGDDHRRSCWCGHRFGDHAVDRTGRVVVRGTRCLAMVDDPDQSSLVMCTCQAWDPAISKNRGAVVTAAAWREYDA